MLDNEFPPLGGGMGTINRHLLLALADNPEIEVDLVTAALGRRSEQEQFAARIRLYKVPVNNRNLHHSSNRELASYSAQALPTAWRLHRSRRYDLCLAWSALPAGAVARALRRLSGLRYLVWITGSDIPGFEARYRRLYPVLTPLIRSVWHHAEANIVKCQGEVDMVRAVSARARLVVIPNAVDLSLFRPRVAAEAGAPLRLICVARLIERKGQHHLIAALRHLLDQGVAATLDLVGTGDSLADYQALAARLGVAGAVRFQGYVPREEIPARLTEADVFVLPSYNEGMSVSTLEALAAGLPVVVTRTGGVEELVEEGVNGLTFDWGDVEMLARHLARLAQEPELRRKMGEAARQKAARFSWDYMVKQYTQLFGEFMKVPERL